MVCNFSRQDMNKRIILAAFFFMAAVFSSAAQDVKTEEEKLSSDYYMALYRDKDTVRADALKTELFRKYPKGMFARRYAAESVNAAADTVEYMALCDSFRKEFPLSDWLAHPDSQGFVYMNFYRGYAKYLYASKQWDKLREVLPEMTYTMLVDLYSHGPMFYIMKVPVDPREYVDIAQDIIDEMYAKKDADVDMYSDGAIRSGAESMKYYLAVQTEVLQRSGRPADAVKCMEKINEEDRYDQYPAGNEAYVMALEELGRDKEAVNAVIGSAAVGRLTPKLFSMLGDHYDSLDPKPSATFDEYYSSLKTEKAKENLIRDVQKGMTDEPYEHFILTSMQGKKVDSSEYGPDDIIVLDFWATWCAPCIAALSGMQLAVDKYADDDNVHFFFVCTQDEPDKARIRRIWKRGNYHDMTVLLDSCRDGSNGYDKVYRSIIHGTSGIPQKAVLKNGRVRYIAEGYGGSPSGLMDEISAVIEILKNE